MEKRLTIERLPKWVYAAIYLLLVALIAFSELGCGTGQIALFPQRPVGPDQSTVEALACRGEIEGAYRYLELRGATIPERVERVEAAKRATAGKPGCCPAGGCAAKGDAK